jgi:hypothetical protein
MYRVRQQDLPFQGSSHQFVGADNGDVNVSVFLLSALPGRGPGPIVIRNSQLSCIGDAPLVQVDVHLSPRFIQENLT